MAIVNSGYTLGIAQHDGQVFVTEWFEDHLGQRRERTYGPVPQTHDFAATLADRVVRLEQTLKKIELRKMIEGGFYAPEYQTVDEAAATLKQMYQDAEREERAVIAIAVLDSITKGVVTDTQWANAFGLTAQQWANVKATKIQPLVDAYAVVNGAVG